MPTTHNLAPSLRPLGHLANLVAAAQQPQQQKRRLQITLLLQGA